MRACGAEAAHRPLTYTCDTLGRAYAPMLFKMWLSGSLADGLGAAISSVTIYLVMAIVLVARPRGLFAAGT